VLNSMGWSIQQVESEDDAVQLQHRDGTTYFISADDFDPDVFENATFNTPRRRLNVPELIKRGAIFITHPHGDNGWETKQPTWDFSLITLQNVLEKSPPWSVEYKKYLRPESYREAIGSQQFWAGLGDDKYKQILWSIKKLGIPDEVAFLDTVKENFAKGIRAYHGNQGGIDTEQLHTPMWFTDSRPDAEYYAGDDGYVVVVNLDIQNPYVIQPGEEANSVLRRWQELQAQGYDGIYDRRLGDWIPFSRKQIRVISKDDTFMGENFADGKVKGKSRPGRVKRAGASCNGSVTDLRRKAKNSSGEKAKMYHWCANMKAGKKKNK
jgi:hypothetical protein